MDGFDENDVTLSGTAGVGSATVVVTGSGDTYDIAVSGISSDGTVTADVHANGAEDAAGNGNTASTSTDNTVTFDTTKPDVTVEQAATQDDPTNAQPINFTATFTEPVTGFDETDVTLGRVGGQWLGDGDGHGQRRHLQHRGLRARLGRHADRRDRRQRRGGRRENGNNASTSTDNEVTYDNTDPESEASSPAFSNASATTIPVDYTASDNVGGTGLKKVELWAKKDAGAWELADTDTSPDIDGEFHYAPSGDGTYRFYTIAVDNAGNREAIPTESDDVTIRADDSTLRDTVAPDPSLSAPPAFTNDDTPEIAGTAGTQAEDGSHSADDGHVTVKVFEGATLLQTHSNVTVGGGGGFSVDATHLDDGTYTARVDQSDAAGNSGFDERDFEVDTVRPDVTVNQALGQADPTNDEPIHFTAVFTEPVDGFGETDVTLSGTAGVGSATVVVTGSGDTYDIAVSGITSDGTVTADVPENGAEDDAGNGNTASTSTDNTVRFDTTNPDVTVEQKSGQPDPTNVQPIEFTATFTEPVTGFDETDVVLGGTAGSGSATVTVTGSGDTYNIAVSGLDADGTLTAEIGVNAAEDAAQNGNNASTSTDNQVLYDATQPEPTLSAPPAFTNDDTPEIAGTAGTQGADSTHSADDDHVTVKVFEGATLLQTHSNVPVDSGDGSFAVDATHLDDGEYTARVEQSDAAGNSGSDERDFEVDTVRPDVTVNEALGQADPTNDEPIHFTAVFTESVTGFDENDVTLSGTAGTGSATVVVTGSGDTYDVAVSGISSDGTVTADVDANGAEDDAGNGNTASTSTDNTVTFDATKPEVTVEQKSTQDDPTNTQPIEFTATFTQSVTGFDETDVVLGGSAGSGSATVTVTGGGDTYNIAVSGLDSDGTLTAEIGANAAEDAAQNGNNASTSTDNEVTYDNTDPESEASSPAFSNASATTIPVDYTASDNLAGLDEVELWAKKDSGAWELADTDTSPGISGQFNYTPSPGDGTYRFYTIAVDNAGNREAIPTEVDAVTIKADSTTLRDTAAPEPTLTAPPALTNDDTPEIAGTAGTQAEDGSHSADDGHVTVKVFEGATLLQTHSNVTVGGGGGFSVDATHLDDGTYTARVDQSDAAGNSGFDEREFEVDATAPELTVEQAAGQDDPTNTQPIHFTATFTEPVTGFDETDVTLAAPRVLARRRWWSRAPATPMTSPSQGFPPTARS